MKQEKKRRGEGKVLCHSSRKIQKKYSLKTCLFVTDSAGRRVVEIGFRSVH